MGQPKVAPYGSWKSPIDARQVAQAMVGLAEVQLEGPWVYWNELRAAEGGRQVVVRLGRDSTSTDMVPAGFSARTRVHEYGGGAYLASGETVIFANFSDQRLYSSSGQGQPQPVTPAADVRYADFVWDRRRQRLIAVRESHESAGEPVNTICAVFPRQGGRAEVLASGNDFYASPRVSAEGSHLAWRTWNHPDMPWDAAELWAAPIREDGSLEAAVHVAGGRGESVSQPEWSPAGVLHFISDRTDWWNLYRWRDGRVEALTELEAEFASPQWGFRMSSYGFEGPDSIVCTYVRQGRWHLARLNAATRELRDIEVPYETLGSVCVQGGRVAFVGGSASRPAAVVLMDLADGSVRELRRASSLEVEEGYLSSPRAIEFPTEGGLTAHGLFYAPRNRDYAAPGGRKPPLVVMAHGGPTSAASPALRLDIQYYTSRGIAVVDVNYGGSTGYGRRYRERLYGQWGVVDVDDCCNAAKWLAERGMVDGRRMAVAGGSAGGYTVLCALAFRKTFAAGSSRFGISDCEALARDTHKFESRYLTQLIGPYPERRDLYVARSAIHHVDGFSCPVIFFQGLEDVIVPPSQTRTIADALRRKGMPVACVEFEGEQHGFRKAENIQRMMEAEVYFLSRVFGFELADPVEPVPIDNL
jgi:dipeptidyl aminopeptidase/acylaminoacyl peptidase